MSIQKPSTPKGTRDFGPEIMARRNYIYDIIKVVFKKFGYEQLETPSMENLSVLTGKYGDEGDQLIFKIVNSGDYLKKTDSQDYEQGAKHLLPKISEKGLRYDLTVPFARYVAMNRGTLSFPFKRFQIQPVWRADRPQKGRYREFYQCDADVIGTKSLICESEIVQMIIDVFSQLKISDYSIKINNRKILSGISELIGAQENESDLFVAIDKLDKIGLDKVIDELKEKGFKESALTTLKTILSTQGTFDEKISTVGSLLKGISIAENGLKEIHQITDFLTLANCPADKLDFDVTLARGLSYYTGAIFEVKVNNVKIGSVSGGGRYDDLTGVFGLPDMSGVGFSFGVDRIYDVLNELDLFPKDSLTSTEVLVCGFDEETQRYGIEVLSKLRSAQINSEIYPEPVKMKKQITYANNKNIPYVIVIGSDELETGILTLKNMKTGDQEKLNLQEILSKLN